VVVARVLFACGSFPLAQQHKLSRFDQVSMEDCQDYFGKWERSAIILSEICDVNG
jgi:hypothetical protein